MDSFSQKVRTFDAFPKVNSQHTVRSQRGGFSTLVTIFCGLMIIWVEIGGFLGGYVDRQFAVDDQIRSDLTLNIDMLVAMPCEFIHTNVLDITRDRYLAGEMLNFEGRDFFLPEGFNINNVNDAHHTPELEVVMQEAMRAEYRLNGERRDENAPACHIYGSIPVNQVKGDFRITGKGFGFRDTLYVPLEALNFTHVIQEFSYGEFYPFIDNPLDASGKTTDHRLQAYQYFSKVVPTRYERLGLVIDTNQYSLTEQHHVFRVNEHGTPEGVPGIYFRYDFEPIKLFVTEKRIPFLQFVAKLATIVGGLVLLAGYLFKLYEKILTVLFGKKYVDKDTEKKSGGILDNEVQLNRDEAKNL